MLPRRVDDIVQREVDVTNQSTPVVTTNKNRILLMVFNDSDQVIYLSHNQAAELHKGIPILPQGKFECANMVICNLYAIHASNKPKRLLVVEGT